MANNYSAEQREFLKNGFAQTKDNNRLLELFNAVFNENRSIESLRKFLYKNGFRRGRRSIAPWNKGKKGVQTGGKKTFKPGNITWCTQEVGEKRFRQRYGWYIKVAMPNKWRLVKDVVYEQAHGKIPDGFLVMYRDGDINNLALNNLVLVSKKEQAVMNRWLSHIHSAQLFETKLALAKAMIAVKQLQVNKNE